MALELINVGNIANDGTGDDLREAFIKINRNFEDLDLRDSEKTTVSNLGVTGEGIFSNIINYDIQLKKIAQGTNVSLAADNEKIVISVPDIGVTGVTLSADVGSSVFDTSNVSFAIEGGDGISTAIVDGVLTITNEYVSEIVEDTTPQLGGNLDAQGYNINNVGTVTGSFVGSLTGLVNGVDPAGALYYLNNIDLGGITVNVTNSIELLSSLIDVDFGTVTSPAALNIDMGSF